MLKRALHQLIPTSHFFVEAPFIQGEHTPLGTPALLRNIRKNIFLKLSKQPINKHLLLALTLAFVYHGVLLLSGDFKHTYDALIHVFFADHYYRYWWNTGIQLVYRFYHDQLSTWLSAKHRTGSTLVRR